MNPGSDGSVTYFFNQLCVGDPAGADQLWQRYSPRLLGLARKILGDRPQAGFDADDVVQSVFISFWKKAANGQFTHDLDRNELWKLLGTITVRKARKRIRDARALKRGGGRVVSESALAGDEGGPFDLDAQLGQIPADDFDQVCEDLFNKLPLEACAIVLLKLMSYTNRDISQILGCTERKVERKLQLIRRMWQELELGG